MFGTKFADAPRAEQVMQLRMPGTITNDNAIAGDVGEYFESTVPVGSAVTLANNTAKTITSIDVAAGDYDVWGFVDWVLGVVTATSFKAGISLVTNALPSQPGGSGLGPDAMTSDPRITTLLSGNLNQQPGPVRLSLAAPATVFLIAQGGFTLGSLSAYGTIVARRRR